MIEKGWKDKLMRHCGLLRMLVDKPVFYDVFVYQHGLTLAKSCL